MRKGQQTISTVEEYILTVLDGSELYGLEIINALEFGSGGKVKLSCGTLYPTLRRLEMKGLVEARWGDESTEERRGARRKYFKISLKGAGILHEYQQVLTELSNWKSCMERCNRFE